METVGAVTSYSIQCTVGGSTCAAALHPSEVSNGAALPGHRIASVT